MSPTMVPVFGTLALVDGRKRLRELLGHAGDALGQECCAYALVLFFGLAGLAAVVYMASR